MGIPFLYISSARMVGSKGVDLISKRYIYPITVPDSRENWGQKKISEVIIAPQKSKLDLKIVKCQEGQ